MEKIKKELSNYDVKEEVSNRTMAAIIWTGKWVKQMLLALHTNYSEFQTMQSKYH